MGIAVLGTVLAVISGDSESGTGFTAGVRAAALTGGLVELAGAALVLGYARGRTGNTEITKEDCHA